MQLTHHATRRTPHGASRLVLAMSTWAMKTRCAPSRRCRDARDHGHTTTAMHDNECLILAFCFLLEVPSWPSSAWYILRPALLSAWFMLYPALVFPASCSVLLFCLVCHALPWAFCFMLYRGLSVSCFMLHPAFSVACSPLLASAWLHFSSV